MVAQVGLIKILGLPQDFCFEGTAADILEKIASFLAVQLPESITNVVVGNSEPSDLQNTALWVRQDNSGTFLGLYVVSQGKWVLVNEWTDFDPVVDAESPMSWTTTTTTYSKYSKFGNTINGSVSVIGTTSGGASNEIFIDLPVDAAGDSIACTASVADGGDPIGATGIIDLANQRISIMKYDAAAFNVGPSVHVNVTFEYEAA